MFFKELYQLICTGIPGKIRNYELYYFEFFVFGNTNNLPNSKFSHSAGYKLTGIGLVCSPMKKWSTPSGKVPKWDSGRFLTIYSTVAIKMQKIVIFNNSHVPGKISK